MSGPLLVIPQEGRLETLASHRWRNRVFLLPSLLVFDRRSDSIEYLGLDHRLSEGGEKLVECSDLSRAGVSKTAVKRATVTDQSV